jgi:hypothetical protein
VDFFGGTCSRRLLALFYGLDMIPAVTLSGQSGYPARASATSKMTQQRHERLKIAAVQLASDPHFAHRKFLV